MEEILSEYILLISSGIFRSADEILKHQYNPTLSQIEILGQMVDHTYKVTNKLTTEKNKNEFLNELIDCVNLQNSLKLQLNKYSIPNAIHSSFSVLQGELFKALKINGAGGGGFFTGINNIRISENFIKEVQSKSGMIVERVGLDLQGAIVLYEGGFSNGHI